MRRSVKGRQVIRTSDKREGITRQKEVGANNVVLNEGGLQWVFWMS
jgi:hypothetical protein